MAEEQRRQAGVNGGMGRPGYAMSVGDQPPAVIGWAKIQRLVIVYMTISSSIGYWLSSALCAVRNFSPALRCERYTAMTWPTTIRMIWANQTVDACASAKLGLAPTSA